MWTAGLATAEVGRSIAGYAPIQSWNLYRDKAGDGCSRRGIHPSKICASLGVAAHTDGSCIVSRLGTKRNQFAGVVE